ncbi:hypothetical protein Aperf_G00000081152 [Anoplocephala perfoliata]
MYPTKADIKRKCFGCKEFLESSSNECERCNNYLQTNDGRAWHAECLICSWCKCPLYDAKNAPSSSSSKCYTRGGRVYCPRDYFGFSPMHNEYKLPPKCMGCQQQFKPGDEVIHSPLHTFHARCFSCDVCGKDLLPGQAYTLLEGYPICLEDDFQLRRMEQTGNCLHLSFAASHSFTRRKRIRTSFNEQQQLSMQAFFAQNQNPNANDLMGLSEETGLAKRVLQVWFQNARAKYRRTTGGTDRNIANSSPEDCE